MTTALALVPAGLQLPAHLATPEAALRAAAANAAAAGGIKVGGFPKVSIEGGKFHEIDQSIDGGNPRTFMVAALAGQPPLPMMCLEAVIIAANPALVKTFYAKKWQKGEAEAPDCQSGNGITPDAHILKPQAPMCATCPQNQWGSKVSEATGKDVKACTDAKQMVILPGADLTYKALGLAVTPSALGDWGKYVKALSDRGIEVNAIVTNITFDHTASFPKLKFAFNRFLTAEEHQQVLRRVEGDDVKMIVSPTRTPVMPALPAPAAVPLLPAPVAQAPVQPAVPAFVPPPPPPVQPTAPAAGFGAATTAPVPAAAPAEAPKRTRRSRAEIDAEKAAAAGAPTVGAGADYSYLPAPIKAALDAVGATSPAGVAILAGYPRPVAPVPPAAPDYSYLPAPIKAALDAVGADSPAGQAMLVQFPKPVAAQVSPTLPAPAAGGNSPVAAMPASAAAPVPAAGGFGAMTAPAAETPATPAVTAAGANLKAILQAKLGITAPAAG